MNINQLGKPAFIKITHNPFFEGKKINISIDLKNSQQLEETLAFLGKEKPALLNILNLI